MRKKAIHGFILLTVLCCFAMLLLPACSMLNVFFDWSRNRDDSQISSRFIGSIRPYRGDAESHYELACYFQERRKHVLAIEEFKKIVEIDPAHVKSYNGMGVSYDSLGDHDRAVESYKAALCVNQNLGYVHNNLGYTHLLKGNLGLAIESFEEAVALDEGNVRFRNNLGLAYAKKGNYDQAFAEFKLAGGEAKAHHNMAQVLYRNGAYGDAADQFNKALAMDPSNKDADRSMKAARSLAGIWATLEKQEEKQLEVEEDAQKPVPPNRKDKEYHNNLSLAYAEKGLEGLAFEPFKLAGGSIRTSYDEKGKTADSFGLGIQTKREGSRKSPGNIEVIEFAEGYRSEGEVPSMNDSQVQISLQGSSLVVSETIIPPGRPLKPKMEIEISNGNGVRYMARRVGEYLKEKGYEVSRLTNAEHFHFADTRIYYCTGYLQDANQVAKEIPAMSVMMEVANLGRSYIKVKVRIGKDLVPHDGLFRRTGSEHDESSPMQIAKY